MKKDNLFVIVCALVTANISYQLIKFLILMFEQHTFTCIRCWGLVVIDIIAIIGMLWLVQNYRKRRKVENEKEAKHLD